MIKPWQEFKAQRAYARRFGPAELPYCVPRGQEQVLCNGWERRDIVRFGDLGTGRWVEIAFPIVGHKNAKVIRTQSGFAGF